MRKILVVCVLLGIAALVLLISVQHAEAATTHYVPTDYPTIQSAVENATAGDTIIVRDGTYHEHVVVNKTLTIRSENGSANCIVGTPGYNVFHILVDYVNISGFTVKGANFIDQAGIYMDTVSHCNISYNNASYNPTGILLKDSSNHNTIMGNTVSHTDGIRLQYSCNHNTITGNNANNSYHGIALWYSSYNTITGNTAHNSTYSGISLGYSSSNSITSNTMVDSSILVGGNLLEHWNTHHIDTSNTVNGKPVYYWKNQIGGTIPAGAGEVILANCTNVNITNQGLVNGSVGILLGFSSNNNVTGNTANNNNRYGIYLAGSSNNTIIDNTANNNNYGIYLAGSSNNTIAGNTAHNNENGIYLTGSSNYNTIAGNTANNNDYGIHLVLNNNNAVVGNNASSNTERGIYLLFSNNNIITGNTANNNNDYGVYIDESSSNTITGNTANNNDDGIILVYSSSNNTVTCNTANSNLYCCIHLGYSSDNNTITGNTAHNNTWGIYLSGSSNNNTITGNTVIGNSHAGIELSASSNNIIYNNYFNNTNNALNNGNNIWNITKTPGTNIVGGLFLGGNYWSNYTGSDTDGDGLGDTQLPYNNSGGIQNGGDYHPLVSDSIKPAIMNVQDSPDPQETGGSVNITCEVTDNWHVNTVKVNITYPDATTVNVTMSGGSYYYNTTYTMVGIYQYFIWAIDVSGNSNTSAIYQFRIKSPPKPKPPTLPDPDDLIYFIGSHERRDGGWVIEPMTLVCFDMEAAKMAGIVAIFYQVDNGLLMLYKGCFTLPLGQHDFSYLGVSRYGVSSSMAHVTIDVVDSYAPVTACTISQGVPEGASGWYRSDVTLTLTAVDEVSDVAATYYKVDDGYWEDYTGPITLVEDGTHIVSYYSVDTAGNKEEETSTTFRIDRTSPTIIFEQPIYGYLYVRGKEILPLKRTVIIGTALISTTAYDETSGMERVAFYMDDEVKETVTSDPFEWLWDERIVGVHTIKAVAYDTAGNIAAVEQEVLIFTL